MPPSSPTLPPLRSHNLSYHIPLLLGPLATESRHSLLSWFDSVSTTRRMPWRKPWIDPSSPLYSSDPSALRSALERRAYEVWISEIMLQQTRVAVVIDYWTRWMARWPTIHDLAVATPDDVLSAWRGLGYYSRATRIHHAARLVVADPAMRGLLPRDVAELERKLPGVGRYTAGALAAIVFGLPAPMVDGNVLRVLSRQLGLFVNVKTDRAAVDLLWAAADALVHAVATCTDTDGPRDASPARADEEAVCLPNDRPGRWGQALMELGSTVCTPKPNCSQCPVTSTCRAYAEGRALASKPEGEAGTKTGHSPDIEDAICTLCHPFEEASVEDTTGDAEVVIGTKEGSKKPKLKVKKQSTLSVFFQQKPTGIPTKAGGEIEVIVDHCRKFPVKGVKKAVREQETVVCAIRRSDDGSYLITRRPDKGLLAGLWELPSRTLVDARGVDEKASSSKTARSKLAKSHVMEMLARKDASGGQKNKLKNINITHEGELGSVPWLFSHLKLTMHVHLFVLDSGWSDADADADADAGVLCTPTAMQRWASSGGEMDGESMGTGMRRCWAMVRDWEQETFG
ncbi:DNA glycosylase [Sodiomyces alkalinus F11]|uniref:Adenine DNA glycosylase n=1 Tax=Sodiomyces alkalinus (strain CBS 110278 / VKM F-3762 / F11) TaxID=1314773 RepID=A0A3N2Q124_SODAK|nr:DNA glycosylase [Sodiomyces alkalinus F11]ROT40451.1 DNA glycosylase [Sodiomyces alkalinus F11]